jgi:hypothetical protein
MSFIIDIGKVKIGVDNAYTNFAGAQCAALVQQAPLISGGQVPRTRFWRRGSRVKDLKWNEIAEGTVIATFDEMGNYPSERRHTGIYVSHDTKGILIIDQWATRPRAKPRTLLFKGGEIRQVDNGDFYWIVETDLTVSSQLTSNPFYALMHSTRFF